MLDGVGLADGLAEAYDLSADVLKGIIAHARAARVSLSRWTDSEGRDVHRQWLLRCDRCGAWRPAMALGGGGQVKAVGYWHPSEEPATVKTA